MLISNLDQKVKPKVSDYCGEEIGRPMIDISESLNCSVKF